jgi:anaerobic ribonucleoside-triphosphate reductase activating protein
MPLTTDAIDEFIEKNGKDITCIAFMGGDAEPRRINRLAQYIHEEYPKLKVAWYSGRTVISRSVNRSDFNYIKIGPYIKHLGPLKERTTNQRMYRQEADGEFVDITARFWR